MELAIETQSQNSNNVKFVTRSKNFNTQLCTIEQTFSHFGLLKNEIKVYLYLARAGQKKAGEIAEAISLHRTETYRILRDLEKKGILFSVFEKPLKFTAIPIDKAIDQLVDAQKMRIKILEKEKANVVELWLQMPQIIVEKAKKELFQMLEGEQQVILKAQEILERSEKELQIFAPSDYLSQLYYSDFTDKLKTYSEKLDITLLTDDSPRSRFFTEQIDLPKEKLGLVEAQGVPCFIISDHKELLIAFHDDDNSSESGDKKKFRTSAIWTNYNAFIWTLQMLFSKLHQDRNISQTPEETITFPTS